MSRVAFYLFLIMLLAMITFVSLLPLVLQQDTAKHIIQSALFFISMFALFGFTVLYAALSSRDNRQFVESFLDETSEGNASDLDDVTEE